MNRSALLLILIFAVAGRSHAGDAASLEFAGRYQLVTIFEALHDMAHPTAVLRTLRGMLAEDGRVLIGDERYWERRASSS